ncbi:MAG: YihY/virulence factor BrkB family protein [Terriglobia bacterium]
MPQGERRTPTARARHGVPLLTMATEITAERKTLLPGRWGRVREVLRDSLVNFLRENSLMVSASIAYYSLLALFPLLLLLLAVSGLFIRRYELSGWLALVVGHYLPVKADFIMRELVGISRAYGRVSILSILLLLWSSSGVFLPIERALNRAWEVEKRRSWWRRRLLALEMAGIFGFLALFSTLLVGTRRYTHAWLRAWVASSVLPLVEFSYRALFVAATFGITLCMFLVLFERLPNRPMAFRQAFPGALLTALLWAAARSLFTHLLPFINYRQVYGSIGVVVALMTWVYISSAIMLFGAQVSSSLYRTWRVKAPAVEALAEGVVESAGKAP